MNPQPKTAEEILKAAYEHHKNVVKPEGNWASFEKCEEDGTTALVYEAMEEYAQSVAQKQAIAFKQYADVHAWDINPEHGGTFYRRATLQPIP